jgi:translocation and assembly module TamB
LTEAAPKRRRWWRILLVLVGLGLVVFGCMAWYVTTNSFQAMVRRRLITEIEQITGGRVELAGFHTTPFRLRVDVRNLTIHGKEAADTAPFVHLDRLVADIHVISAFSLRFGFHDVSIDHPLVHIIVYPDGTTNEPEPALKKKSDGTPVDQFFDLRIARLTVNRGELLWNDERIPLDFSAADVNAHLQHSFLRRHYEAQVTVGKIDTRIQDYRPFAWRADANFTLGRDSVEVKSLVVNSGPSQLKFQGAISDFRSPALKGNASLELDLTDVAAILRQRPLRRGKINIVGAGQCSLKDFSFDGALTAREFEWRDEGMNLQNVSLNSKVSLRPQRIFLSDVQARLLGGVISGDGQVTNWLTRPESIEQLRSRARRTLNRAEQERLQRGIVHARFSSLELPAIKRAFSTRKLPLEEAHFSGTVAGTAEVSWVGTPSDAETKFVLRIDPPNSPARQDIPLTLNARGAYRLVGDELEIHDLTATTPSTTIRADGTLSRSASARFNITTRDLREWEPFLKRRPLPLSLHGRATLNGTLAGRVHDPHVTANLQLTDFETTLPATARRPETEVHWDSASADMQYSSSGISAKNLTILHGASQIKGDVSVELRRGEFSDASHISVRLDLQHGDVAELLALAGYGYPVTGNIDLHAQFAGTIDQPGGGGHLQLTNAVAYGQSISKFESDVRFANGEAQFTNLILQQGDATVTGTAAYGLASRTYRLNLTGSNFELSRVERIQNERFTIAGLLSFKAQGGGTLDEPSIDADLHIADLTLSKERLGDFDAHAITQGSRLQLEGTSNFRDAQLHTTGTITLRDDYPADLKIDFAHLDIDSLLRIYLRGQVTGHSAVEGQVELHGPLRKPSDLAVTASVTQFSADVDKVNLHNEGPIRLAFSKQTVSLDQFHLVGTGTDLVAHGTAQIAGDRTLDLRADGTLNLTLLQTWVPDLTSSGNVAVGVNVTGALASPVFRGQVRVSDGALTYSDLPTGLTEMNGTLTFNENQLQVQSLTARTGGGTLNVTGAISYYRRQILFDLKGTAQEVRLRYPPGISSTTNADLHFSGTNDAATLSGELTVMKLSMTPGFDFGSYLERAKLSAQAPQANSPLNRIKLDLHVTTTPELQMQTALAKLSGDADLRVRGSAARRAVLGRVDILEGEVFFNGAKYRLERGDVIFTNPVRIEPILDLEASTRVSDYDVTIGLNGTFDKLNVNYRSEPPLPSADIIALLALGRTREESASLENSSAGLSGAASNLILSEALNATLSSRVQRLFGVSRIKIDPQGLPSATNVVRGPQVTIEQQVASNLTLTYSTNVAVASQQIIQLEYNVTRTVSIVALRDQNGVVSFDIKIRRRKK